jgi:dTDP-4-amino-4,6-dideoxygalactose transaminase
MKLKEPINITKPFVPPFSIYEEYLKDIWKLRILSNHGKYEKILEDKLKKYFNINYLSLFNNGTNALLIGLKALCTKGEVITTPYTFAATTNSIYWNGLTPIFCDIDPIDFNIDVEKIESLITKKTTAIMPVHVYGNPCKIKEIKEISEKYNLKVIYDAAHTFNTRIDNESIYNYGDISILSFHATKVFNTIEGGAIIANDQETNEKINLLKNFGLKNEKILLPGINGKMNEIQAAFGLASINYMIEEINKRKERYNLYRECLDNLKGISLVNIRNNIDHCYPYFPIFINKKIFGHSRDDIFNMLRINNIFTKKYFFPLTSSLDKKNIRNKYNKSLVNAEKASSEVLCLPLYSDLSFDIILYISKLIINKYK